MSILSRVHARRLLPLLAGIIAKVSRFVKTNRENTQFFYNFSSIFSSKTSPTPWMPLNTQGTMPASR